jgi:hypothetical protein
LSAKCPKCKETIELKQLPLPAIPVPLSSFSYTQKLFPLYRRYGIATFGMNALQGQTVYRHMKQFEADNTVPPSSVQELGAQLQAKFQTLLEQQIKELQKAPDNFWPLGFHVGGCDGTAPRTAVVHVGKTPKIRVEETINCTVGGEGSVVTHLWALKKADPKFAIDYRNFSLQDAVDYARFLIEITEKVQRFTPQFQTVGGEVDVALITPDAGFIWIQGKTLTLRLEGMDDGH